MNPEAGGNGLPPGPGANPGGGGPGFQLWIAPFQVFHQNHEAHGDQDAGPNVRPDVAVNVAEISQQEDGADAADDESRGDAGGAMRVGELGNPDHDEDHRPVLPDIVEVQDSDVPEQEQDSHRDDAEPDDQAAGGIRSAASVPPVPRAWRRSMRWRCRSIRSRFLCSQRSVSMGPMIFQ